MQVAVKLAEEAPAEKPPLWTVTDGVTVALGLVLHRFGYKKLAYAAWAITGADMVTRQMEG